MLIDTDIFISTNIFIRIYLFIDVDVSMNINIFIDIGAPVIQMHIININMSVLVGIVADAPNDK